MSLAFTHTLARTDTPWHRLDVRHWDALAHTSVGVLGVLDTHAVEAIDRAVRTADAQRHTLSLDLQQISSVTSEPLDELLAPHSSRRTADRFHVAGSGAGSVTDQLVVKSIVDIARGMGMKTIAEFVEDAETVEMLREKGVDYSQGYHHGRPQLMTQLHPAR